MVLAGEYEPGTFDTAREQVAEFEASNGARANTMLGKPIVVITSVGAKSGRLRKTPVMRVEHGGQYLAVASMAGAPEHPTWYFNLKANPLVELQDGPVKQAYEASEITGELKDEWWERAVTAFPNYANYQQKTNRTIPVFLLTPVG